MLTIKRLLCVVSLFAAQSNFCMQPAADGQEWKKIVRWTDAKQFAQRIVAITSNFKWQEDRLFKFDDEPTCFGVVSAHPMPMSYLDGDDDLVQTQAYSLYGRAYEDPAVGRSDALFDRYLGHYELQMRLLTLWEMHRIAEAIHTKKFVCANTVGQSVLPKQLTIANLIERERAAYLAKHNLPQDTNPETPLLLELAQANL
jgi:hypothetical protein